MRRSAAWAAALAVAAAVLAGCGGGGGSTSQSTSPAATQSATASPTATAVAAGAFCQDLTQAQKVGDSMETTMVSAMSSGSFTKIQQQLETFWTSASQGLHRVEGAMSSAPANVQAAVATVNSFYGQFLTAVKTSTSVQQLGTKVASLGANPQLQKAYLTLKTYDTQRCGTAAG